jgi:hypothetical protein
MQRVTRVCRQELRQRLCGTPLPAANRPRDADSLDSKSSEQSDTQLRHASLGRSVHIRADDRAYASGHT